jgi:hypothetical protein
MVYCEASFLSWRREIRCCLSNQGCQMVNFLTKNPNLGTLWRALGRKLFLYFMIIWNVLWLFGIIYGSLLYVVCGHLVYFSHFGMFGPKKSGNPVSNFRLQFQNNNFLSHLTFQATKKTLCFYSTFLWQSETGYKPGLPDFSLFKIHKQGNVYQIATELQNFH